MSEYGLWLASSRDGMVWLVIITHDGQNPGMNYDPYQDVDRYQQPPGPYQQQPGHPYPPGSGRRDDGANTVIAIVRVVTGITTAIFMAHILFVVLEANQGNGFVSFVYSLAKALVLGLGDVFTPDDAKVGVVLNYGFAAILYLVVGQLVIKALRRR